MTLLYKIAQESTLLPCYTRHACTSAGARAVVEVGGHTHRAHGEGAGPAILGVNAFHQVAFDRPKLYRCTVSG